jgi:hypothetical protein
MWLVGLLPQGLFLAAGLQLTIDGKVVDPKVPFSFATGKDLDITLGSTTGSTFRGFLVRVSTSTNDDTTGFLKGGTDANVQALGPLHVHQNRRHFARRQRRKTQSEWTFESE